MEFTAHGFFWIGIGQLVQGDDQFRFAACQIKPIDSVIGRVGLIRPGVCTTGISIAGAVRLQTREIEAVGILSIGCHGVNRPFIVCDFPAFGIADHTLKSSFAPVIMNEPLLRIGGVPLQHCALLPVPGMGVCQLDEPVIVIQVDYSNADRVIGSRRAVIETGLVGQQQTSGSVPG